MNKPTVVIRERIEGIKCLLDVHFPDWKEPKSSGRLKGDIECEQIKIAVFPQDKFQALIDNHPNFKSTWERTRGDLDSDSSFDFALVLIAIRHGWSDDKQVALIRENRKRYDDKGKIGRADYYERTIDRAKKVPSFSRSHGSHSKKSSQPMKAKDEVFHGPIGEIVKLMEPHTEADPMALLAQCLVVFGNIVGRGSYFLVEATRHFPILFILVVGATSKGRKGTSEALVRLVFEQVDPDWNNKCRHSGMSSGEGLIYVIRDEMYKSERTKDKGVVRYEEVLVDTGIEDKRALVTESEFATPLKNFERQGNTLSSVIRDTWDSQKLGTMTKNSKVSATDPHISIIGHITAEELERLVTETQLCNGLLNRFCIIFSQRSKILPFGGDFQIKHIKAQIVRLREAVNFASSAGQVKRNFDADEIWAAVYPELSEGKPGLAGAAIARGEAQVMRIALIYALADQSPQIKADHMIAALSFWGYAEDTAKQIFGSTVGNEVADEILRLLKSNPGGISRTDISNHFQRHKKKGQIGQALGFLRDKDLAIMKHEKTEGRSVEKWSRT